MAVNSNHKIYIVPEDWDAKRLDAFLADQDTEHSRSFFQRLIAEHFVTVNDQETVKPSYAVRKGDAVVITRYPEATSEPAPEATPLDILYEDGELLVVNKPSNLTVHPTARRSSGTLVNSILHHSLTIAEAVYDVDSLVSRLRPGIVHRLDKDTSGVMVIAKTPAALQALAKQFHDRTVKKEYTAILYGHLREPVTVTVPIRRKLSRKNMMGVSLRAEEGKPACTRFRPLQYLLTSTKDEITVASCIIETGRTHQIRVHSKYLGHPVIGDPIYTNKPNKRLSERLGIHRQLLHASSLTLIHPKTGKEMHFTAPLPEDIQALLTKLTPAASVAA